MNPRKRRRLAVLRRARHAGARRRSRMGNLLDVARTLHAELEQGGTLWHSFVAQRAFRALCRTLHDERETPS